jgi:phosphatidate cytidylyltransferase
MTLTPKQTRVLLGALLLVLVAGIFWLDYLLDVRAVGSAVAVILGLAAYWEYARMAGLLRSGSGRALGLLGLLGCACILAVVWRQGGAESREAFVAGGIGFLLSGFAVLTFRADYRAGFHSLLAALLGVLLFGVCYSYLLRIYHQGDRERALVVGAVFLLGVKGTDIIAYLAGSTVGRHHFLKISPGKTLEGCSAAVIQGALWFGAAGWLWPDFFFSWPQGILFGIILSLVSQLGDLTESVIKRCFGVKDSGSLLPEFGGVLDLVDSFLFSGFVFWCLL